MKKFLAWMVAGLVTVQGAWAAAPAVLSETAGFSFQQYTGSATVGIGEVNVDNTLFFIDEGVTGGMHSWYIFFDAATPSRLEAMLQFEQPVLAVYDTRASIDATTPVYGLSTVRYGSRSFTGLEGSDSLTWADNILLLDWHVASPGDHVRVLTAVAPAVPEPASLPLLAGGLVLVVYLARRRLGNRNA